MPPRVISEAELRALPPQFKALGTLYTPNYRTNWGDWHIIRELYQNSCPYHCPILILKDGKVSLVPIGEFVEANLDSSNEGYCKEKVYALSCVNHDTKGYRLQWRPIAKVYRHPYQGNMVRVHLTNGFEVEVTTGHSLFRRFYTSGHIQLHTFPTSKLEQGDYIAIPFSHHLNLNPTMEYFDLLSLDWEDDELVIHGQTEYFESIGIPINQEMKTSSTIPLSLLREYGLSPPADSKIGYKNDKDSVPRLLDLEALAWLMGLYLAGGSIPGGTQICLSIGADQQSLLTKIEKAVTKLGGTIKVTHRYSAQLDVHILPSILAHLFLKLGFNQAASNKRIPNFIFNLGHKYQMKFLEGYRQGDGYGQQNQPGLILTTCSPYVATGLQYLFLLNGIPFSINPQKRRDGYITKTLAHCEESYAFCTYYHRHRSKSPSPITRHKLGDISFVGVKKIERLNYDKPYVYDIGVPGAENFVGGKSPIILHNSLDEHDELGITALPLLDRVPEGVIIRDSGRGIGVEGLLFKERKVTADLRGTFGEGLKIACNAALRRGYEIQIESPIRSIEPVYVDTEVNGRELILYFISRPQRPGITGTTILIKGYNGPLFLDRFTQFISAPVHTRPVQIGRFLRQDGILREPANRLYIRDIYVRDLSETRPSRFSYNLWEVETDPDREAEKSTSELEMAIAKLWATVTDPVLITQFLRDASNEGRYEYQVQFGWFEALDLVRRVQSSWESAWIELYGRKAVLWTDPGTARIAEMYGYQPIIYPFNVRSFLEQVVPSDESVSRERIEELKRPRPIPPDELAPQQRKHLEAIRWLHSQLGFPNSPSIIPADIPPDPRTEEKSVGLYTTEENIIYLTPSVLDYMGTTVATYIHELGHFLSHGAIDGTRAHVEGMEEASARVTKALIENPTHPVWRDVIWS